MENVSIMLIPNGFKIRSKSDINTFMNKCMQKGDEYLIEVDETQYTLRKDKIGIISVLVQSIC